MRHHSHIRRLIDQHLCRLPMKICPEATSILEDNHRSPRPGDRVIDNADPAIRGLNPVRMTLDTRPTTDRHKWSVIIDNKRSDERIRPVWRVPPESVGCVLQRLSEPAPDKKREHTWDRRCFSPTFSPYQLRRTLRYRIGCLQASIDCHHCVHNHAYKGSVGAWARCAGSQVSPDL